MKRLLVAAMFLVGGAALASDAVDRLADQARFLESRSQLEQAVSAWQRVLRARPEHPEALSRLSVISARRSQSARSERYLEDLVDAVGVDDPLVGKTRGEIRVLRELDGVALSSARQAASAGNRAEALELYERAFGGGKPLTAPLALEYYQLMTGVESRKAEALAGLESLAASSAKAEYAYAHARQLTYQPRTRREGIDRLLELAESGFRKDAIGQEIRTALGWLGIKAFDAARIGRYEALYGDDAALSGALAEARAAPEVPELSAVDVAIRDGFEALDGGNLEQAERHFRDALGRDGSAADAEAGLALVALRRERFTDADRRFERAFSQRSSLRRKYADAASTARYWATIEGARNLDSAGELAQAEARYRAAFSSPPPGGIDAGVRSALIDVLLRRQKLEAAEVQLEQALRAYPDDIALESRYIGLLLETGRDEAAAQRLRSLEASNSASLKPLRARIAKTRARLALREGRLDDAEEALRQALVADSQDPWTRLELARTYKAQGKEAKAQSLFDSLVSAAADSSEGWLARAYALGEAERWHDTLMSLEKIPPGDRDAGARALQRRAWIEYQIMRVENMARRGDLRSAQRLMVQVNGVAGSDTAFAAALARGWAMLGDPARAVAVLRAALNAEDGISDDGARIQYAGLLLELDQDAEFEAVALDLIRRGGLTAEETASLESLVVGYRIKLADRARESGALDQAFEELRDVLARYPEKAAVNFALARLLVSSGETGRAIQLITRVLAERSTPTDTDLQRSLDVALMARHEPTVERLLARMQARDSMRLNVLIGRARLAEQRGQTAKARDLYRQARTAETASRPPRAVPNLTRIEAGAAAAAGAELTGAAPARAQTLIGPLLPRATERRAPGRSAGQPESSGAALASALSAEEPSPAGEEVIDAEVAGWWAGGIHSRSRDGESGLSRLLEVRAPFEWVSTETPIGRFGIGVQPVSLTSGRIDGEANLNRFATTVVFGPAGSGTDVSASGVGFSAAYRNGDVHLDLGTTPLGFEVTNLVGGLLWTPSGEHGRLSVDLSRRAVTDSVLSYSGIQDPREGGLVWGGVVEAGGRLDFAYDLSSYGAYVNGGYHTITGKNVPDNKRFGLGGGLFFRVRDRADQEVTVGLNVTTISYDKNLRFFSFGHGGYFSPQFFGALTVPFRIVGRYRGVTYRFDAALGLQSFREDGAALYPERPALQAAAQSELAQRPDDPNLLGGYPDKDESGVAYRIGVSGRYRVTPRFDLIGMLSADNAEDFAEYRVGVTVRWYLSPQVTDPLTLELPNQHGVPMR